ncbi:MULTISPECIES: hypothetical protein [Pseudomonas syringae group]|uniref:Uncharacterized protein n=1 Tax=Pseudomonas syringae pv. spinaceae TaxID=264459 RepID=A0A0Q0FZG9_PSESX|nr:MULTISPECIES: hypothetical protein [Pseudomonas syringae group]KPW39527.1 Uncharacterized protein ALO87_03823 [Pseudomonas syringae pv. apii]KPY70292.1 Uncharacterized protein ALO94_01541 [Pseudomonas syringae pv. spinaceae]RMT27182.1 hypothetical protein ALP50_01135 [Pseudomonas syringae pv. spinaceae]
MDRNQIRVAQQLFYERDNLQVLLDAVVSGKELAVSIRGTWQDAEVAAQVQRPLRDYYQQKVNAINAQLKQLGWSGK